MAAWRARSRWTSCDRLFVVWAIVVIVFFSLSKSKRPDYILSAIVALGALTARILDLALTGNEPSARLLRRATAGLSVICLAGGGGLLVARLQPHILANLIKMQNAESADIRFVLMRLGDHIPCQCR